MQSDSINYTLAKFVSKEREKAFEQKHLLENKIFALIAIALPQLFSLIFIYSDYKLFGFSDKFTTLLIGRFIFLSISTLLFIIIVLKNKTRVIFTSIIIWYIITILVITYIDYNRPDDFFFYLFTDLGIVIFFYIFIPNGFSTQVIMSVAFTIIILFIVFVTKSLMPPAIRNTVIVSFIMINIFGSLFIWRLHISKRVEFLKLEQEKELRKEQELLLTQKNKLVEELRKSDNTKDKLMGIIAHDLKSQFNTILGFTELLTGSDIIEDKAQVHKIAHLLHNSAQKTYDLLENLLKWAQIQKKQIIIIPEKIDLSALLDYNISLFKETAKKKDKLLKTRIRIPYMYWLTEILYIQLIETY